MKERAYLEHYPKEPDLNSKDKETIILAGEQLGKIKEGEQGWDFYAGEVINYRLEELRELQERLGEGPDKEKVKRLIRQLNDAIPDSFEAPAKPELKTKN